MAKYPKETRNMLKGIDGHRKKGRTLSVLNELGEVFLLARMLAEAELEQPKQYLLKDQDNHQERSMREVHRTCDGN